jgi:hypothetical protein
MATIETAPPSEPGQPLPTIFEFKAAAPITVHADHATGLLVIAAAIWPALRLVLAPEVALELSLHLVSRVRDLRHDRRS